MSEYQYYEFRAIDRPLTTAEQQAVSRMSSRVSPHPRRAVFTYNYSSFPGSAHKVLGQYYDALFYITNWGSLELGFRFPKALLDVDQIAPYCVDSFLEYDEVGDYVVLLFSRGEGDPPDEWVEGEGMLDDLLPLRQAILAGDYRVLYLTWLLGVQTYDDEWLSDEEEEPPVPAGLSKLTEALREFVDLFEVNESLLEAAAQRSISAPKVTSAGLQQAIAALSPTEQQAWLLRLAQDEANLAQQFQRRLPLASPMKEVTSRTVGELRQQAEQIEQAKRERQKAAAAARHAQEMDALALRAEDSWRWVQQLIEQKNTRAYDEAVTNLKKLQQLAQYQGKTAEFQARVTALAAKYTRLGAFLQRLRTAKLG